MDNPPVLDITIILFLSLFSTDRAFLVVRVAQNCTVRFSNANDFDVKSVQLLDVVIFEFHVTI